MEYRFQSFLSGERPYSIMIKQTSASVSYGHHDYHPHYEIYYYRGEQKQNIVINGKEMIADTPSIVISEPYSIHGMSLAEHDGEPFPRFTVYFTESYIDTLHASKLLHSMLANKPNCIYRLSAENNKIMSTLFDLMLAAQISEDEFSSYLSAMLFTLNRVVSPDDCVICGRSGYYLANVLRYIYENKSSDLSVERVAREFHISRAKLDRDFRRYVGKSVHSCIIELRLGYAIQLLKHSKLKVKEISSMCGFESEYYFYAFIKRNTGKTPLALRNEISAAYQL